MKDQSLNQRISSLFTLSSTRSNHSTTTTTTSSIPVTSKSTLSPTLKSSSPIKAKRSHGPRKPHFIPRSSRLDSYNTHNPTNQYRGFITALCLSILIYTFSTLTKYYRQSHNTTKLPPLLLELFTDTPALFLSDIVMGLSTFVSIIIHKSVMKFGIRNALIIQHTWQLAFMCFWLGWVFIKEWKWVQSAFFSLHCISLLMKQHSYISSNREFHEKYERISRMREKFDHENKDLQQEKEIEIITQELTAEITTGSLLSLIMINLNHYLGATTYPQNVTLFNFVDFLFCPTLVYDLEYPRIPKFRVDYFATKFFGIVTSFFLLYMTVEHYVFPVLHDMPNLSFVDSLVDLLCPFMVRVFSFLCPL